MADQLDDMYEFAADDVELRDRMLRLANKSFDFYEWVMEYGTRAERTAFAKLNLPGMLRSVLRHQDSERDRQSREAHEEMRAMFRSMVADNRPEPL